MEVVHNLLVSGRGGVELLIGDGAAEVIDDGDVVRVLMRVDTCDE